MPEPDAAMFVSRAEWGAQSHTETTLLNLPLNMVVVHHTSGSWQSHSREQGLQAARCIQQFHMGPERNWADIGYNFLVGEDGTIYEGRGWSRQGAHARGFNHVSFGVSVIGAFTSREPSEAAMAAVGRIIQEGVDKGHLSPSYTLCGHRDVGDTDCPGEAFYQGWVRVHPHYSTSHHGQ